MPAVFDAIGTNVGSGAAKASPMDFTTLTIGQPENGALAVHLAWLGAPPAGLTVTWDPAGANQALTQIISQQTVNGQTAQLWGLLNPAKGNKTLRIAWSAGTTELHVQAVSLTGVDQTHVSVAFQNAIVATGNTAAPAVTVVSANGNLVLGTVVAGSLFAISSVNNTQDLLIHGAGILESGGNRAAGAATVALSAVYAGIDQWAYVGVDVLAFVPAAILASASSGLPDRFRGWRM